MLKNREGLHDDTGSNIRRTTATACVGLLKDTQALQAKQSDAAADTLVDAACGRGGSTELL